jgi:exosortase
MRAFKQLVYGKSALRLRDIDQLCQNNHLLIFAALLPLVILVWSYWPVIEILIDDWQNNDDYSAGQLVPIVALFLLWRERKSLKECSLVPCWWGGIALLLLAEAASIHQFLTGGHPSIERYLMILALAGLVLLVAGWQVFKAVKWILLFLFLMVPLPGRVHNLISGPLQRIATTGSVFLLEAFGATVSQQGNVIMLNETTPMAVAEACSGLRMMTAFVIVAAFMAYMVKRSRFKKAVLFFSSIPVAVMCNILRLCVTAVLFMIASSEVAEKFFHDFAGLAMMPVAVLLMFAELWLLDKLIEPETADAKSQNNKKGQ